MNEQGQELMGMEQCKEGGQAGAAERSSNSDADADAGGEVAVD